MWDDSFLLVCCLQEDQASNGTVSQQDKAAEEAPADANAYNSVCRREQQSDSLPALPTEWPFRNSNLNQAADIELPISAITGVHWAHDRGDTIADLDFQIDYSLSEDEPLLQGIRHREGCYRLRASSRTERDEWCMWLEQRPVDVPASMNRASWPQPKLHREPGSEPELEHRAGEFRDQIRQRVADRRTAEQKARTARRRAVAANHRLSNAEIPRQTREARSEERSAELAEPVVVEKPVVDETMNGLPSHTFHMTPHVVEERRFEVGSLHMQPPTFELGSAPPPCPPPAVETAMITELHNQLHAVRTSKCALVAEATHGKPASGGQLERLHRLDAERDLALHRLASLYANALSMGRPINMYASRDLVSLQDLHAHLEKRNIILENPEDVYRKKIADLVVQAIKSNPAVQQQIERLMTDQIQNLLLSIPIPDIESFLDPDKPEKGKYAITGLQMDKVDIPPDSMGLQVDANRIWLQMQNTSMSTNDFNFSYNVKKAFLKASDESTITCGISQSKVTTQFDVGISPTDGRPTAEELRIEITLGPLDLQVKDARHKTAYDAIFRLVKNKGRKFMLSCLYETFETHDFVSYAAQRKIEGALNAKLAENTNQMQDKINDTLRVQALEFPKPDIQSQARHAVEIRVNQRLDLDEEKREVLAKQGDFITSGQPH
eukprot:SAG31_NODE_231_length_19768_cov_9.498170_19_plen_667_part_00